MALGQPGGRSAHCSSVQQFCLAARAYGIATSLTMLYGGHEDERRELPGLPPDALTMALIPTGYPPRDGGLSPGAGRLDRSCTGIAGCGSRWALGE
jgi:hypothetical protein